MSFFEDFFGLGESKASQVPTVAAPDITGATGTMQGGIDRAYGTADRLEAFGGQAYDASQQGVRDYSQMAMSSANKALGLGDDMAGYGRQAYGQYQQYGLPALARLDRGYEEDPRAMAEGERRSTGYAASMQTNRASQERQMGRMGLNPNRYAAMMAAGAPQAAAGGVGAWNQGRQEGMDRYRGEDREMYGLMTQQQQQAGAFGAQAANMYGAGTSLAGQSANAWLPGASFKASTYKPEVGQYGIQGGLGMGGLQNQQYGTQMQQYGTQMQAAAAEDARPSPFGTLAGLAVQGLSAYAGGGGFKK